MRLPNDCERVLMAACTAALLLGLIAAPAAVADQQIMLYDGQLQGLGLASWGNGTCGEIPEDSYRTPVPGQPPPNCIRVDAQGLYAGGRLDLANPIPLNSFFRQPGAGYIELYVKVFEGPSDSRPVPVGRATVVAAQPGPEETGLTPELAAYLEQLRTKGVAAVRGGGGGEGEEGQEEESQQEEEQHEEDEQEQQEEEEQHEEDQGQDEGGGGGAAAPVVQVLEMKKMADAVRIIVVTDKGTMCSATTLVDRAEADPDGWIRIIMPFADAGRVGDVASASLSKIALTADAKDYFLVGRVALLQEDRPLVAEPGQNKTVRVGEAVTFTAAAQTNGEANVRYAWDFSQADELREDALGRTVEYTFEHPGYYIVTLVVSDLEGKRVPHRDTITVLVR